ncbi:MAG: hypothetical protein FJ276_20190, partial [Planctomycetes bacterium]|nr:hypothetical protein [Planctomycetota bacterium]
KGHRQAVTSVAFSRDGRNVLSGSRDGTAVIWPSVDWQPTSPEQEERDISRGEPGNSGDPSAPALPPKAAS